MFPFRALPREMTRRAASKQPLRRSRRRGSILPLVAVFLVVLLAMAMFMVDVAYMQLIRTELRAATDAAAKAGVEALARNQNPGAARAAAIAYAAQNRVAGSNLHIRQGDIVVGTAAYQPNGTWAFTPGGAVPNAVRVTSSLNASNSNGSVPLFLAGMFGNSSFSPERESTAASLELEVCLAIDRSHSMCFDMSGVDWSYPPAVPRSPHPICYPPDPSDSRWAQLDDAVLLFLSTCEQSALKPKVALVTWGSTIGTGTAEYHYTQQTAPAVFRDAPLSLDYTPIRNAIQARSNNVMLGGTHMSAGMDESIDLLTAPGTKSYARKIMILMTDGQWNMGQNPTTTAQAAVNKHIVIHTITFLDKADQTTMKQVAALTGGQHYHASNGAELAEAFEALARTLPVVMTE